MIKPFQTLIRRSGHIAVIAHQTAHYITILLFHMAAIILLVRARPGKGNLLLAAVGVESLIDEFTAVVRVYTEQVEREALPHPVDGGTYPHLAFTPDRQAFRPAAGNVYSAECVQIKASRALTAMSDQVNF